MPALGSGQGHRWVPPHLVSPSAGAASRPQGQVCLAGLAGYLRGQLDGLCALLVLLGALPWACLPGGDCKSTWAQGPDPCGVLRDLVGGVLGGLGGEGKELGKLLHVLGVV